MWEGQGRGWLFSQLKRGSYHFLPRQGSTSPGPAFLCGFCCPESVMDLGEWGASVWERTVPRPTLWNGGGGWGWRMGVEGGKPYQRLRRPGLLWWKSECQGAPFRPTGGGSHWYQDRQRGGGHVFPGQWDRRRWRGWGWR